ncbi:hypothetical protein [Bacillus sp. P14.5]|uniref:hypothetical protein n=1 Tax=Bacillus sp. P14.5 TaxID=1983400 RepID=UPI000DEA1EF6|nr:hypothetical protein [Bacillus sp. P14.5]
MIIEEGKTSPAALIVDNIDYDKDPGFIFLMLAHATEIKHRKFVKKIIHSEDTFFNNKVSSHDEYLGTASSLITELRDTENHPVENLANIKYLLDSLFLLITQKGSLKYEYRRDYLHRSESICKNLGISKSTLSRYVKLGLEVTDATSHYRYPAHVTYYWHNALWASRIQALYQAFKLRNRTTIDIIKELQEENKKYETNHADKSFYDVYANIENPDELEEPDEYYDWKDIIEELEELQNENKSE